MRPDVPLWSSGLRSHLEREAERGNLISGMIVRVGELRQSVELLAAFWSLVDA